MNRDMTQGSPAKLILYFLVPVLMGNLFQQFYNIVDSIIVGRFIGVEALAAVGSTSSLVFLVIGFVSGLCSGLAIPIAYDFGAKDKESLTKDIANIIFLCTAVAVVLTLLVVSSAKGVLQMMNTPSDIFDDAYAYLIIIYAGLGITVFYNILACISRALGDSKTPLYFLMMSAFLNIALDLFFVIVLNLRTAGAAYATILSQAIAGICCFAYMVKKFPEIRIGRENMKIDLGKMKHLLSTGIPMALQFSITAVGSIILQSTINPLGSTVVASVTAAGKVQLILIQPFEAIGVTMATYASQNLGAGRLDRITQGVKSVLIMNIGICILAFIGANLLGPTISRLFISGDQPEIFAYIKEFLFVNSILYYALGSLLILRNALQGMGYTVPAMGAGIFELGARALVGVLFVRNFGFSAICFANGTAWIAANILLIPLYFTAMSQLKKKYRIKPSEKRKEPVCCPAAQDCVPCCD